MTRIDPSSVEYLELRSRLRQISEPILAALEDPACYTSTGKLIYSRLKLATGLTNGKLNGLLEKYREAAEGWE